MKHRVLWSFGPAPERASDRKGWSRVGRLSGRTTRGRATETEGVSQRWRKRAETCGNVSQTCRVRSVHYTTARAFSRLCRLARRYAYAESRCAGPGRHCCPRRAPVAGFLGDWADVAPVLAFFAGGGHVGRPGPGRRHVWPVWGNVRLFVGPWLPRRGHRPRHSPFLLECRLGQEPKLAKGRRWGRMRLPDRGR
jgi:hypothetical protein